MKAGEKDRVGALRLVLSELQKAAKEGADDEQAVLRRERKRRREAESTFRDAGRAELADQEAYEAGVIEAYLPQELSDDELDGARARRDRRDRRREPARHGPGDQARDGRRAGPRRRQPRVREGQGALA